MAKNNASPPFATSGGKPVAPTSGASGAHDFVKDNSTAPSGGGGFDVTKQNRPQAEADPRGAGNPDAAQIPQGGKDMLADPGKVSAANSSNGGTSAPKPYKSLK